MKIRENQKGSGKNMKKKQKEKEIRLIQEACKKAKKSALKLVSVKVK
jgi:hypothetical protein